MHDAHDRRLLAHVRPPDWRNPPPKPLYDLVVIGGGTAGLVSAAGAAGLGARVALIERSRLGGDCLNTGCVPSKALLHSARAGHDFAAAMAHLRASRAAIAPHDSAARLSSRGVDVFFGDASFSSPRTISVRASEPNAPNADQLRFRKAIIATGSRPSVPAIAGLADVPFLTSESVFDIAEQPDRLAILGGGPIGCELAQAFARLGTRVTLIEAAAHLLPREDPDAGAIVADALERDGVTIATGLSIDRVSGAPGAVVAAHARGEIRADALLVATGRTPNVDRVNLEAAGIERHRDGIRVDDRLRTTNPRVYAAGDVASRYQFTHAADALARTAIRNALFFGRRRASRLVIPWCTFTSPEVAHVGVTSAEARGQGGETMTVPLTDVDRAVVDDETNGFVRVHHRQGRIVGATIVASRAGELIGTLACAMQTGGSLARLSATVFPYPTLSGALRQAADAHQRTRLTPAVRQALRYYFRLWSRLS